MKLTLTEQQVEDDLIEFIMKCDSDELCDMFGHAFGMDGVVKGITKDDVYEFEPIEGKYGDPRPSASRALARVGLHGVVGTLN